jgi:hypothetical protein
MKTVDLARCTHFLTSCACALFVSVLGDLIPYTWAWACFCLFCVLCSFLVENVASIYPSEIYFTVYREGVVFCASALSWCASCFCSLWGFHFVIREYDGWLPAIFVMAMSFEFSRGCFYFLVSLPVFSGMIEEYKVVRIATPFAGVMCFLFCLIDVSMAVVLGLIEAYFLLSVCLFAIVSQLGLCVFFLLRFRSGEYTFYF